MTDLLTAPSDVKLQRSVTLQTLAVLAERHDLPIPQAIHFPSPGFRLLKLRLEDNDRAGVAAWASVLGLSVEPDSQVFDRADGPNWVSANAERNSHDGPFWMSWSWVHVWSAVDVPAAGGAA